jgi:hypothetical protein
MEDQLKAYKEFYLHMPVSSYACFVPETLQNVSKNYVYDTTANKGLSSRLEVEGVD